MSPLGGSVPSTDRPLRQGAAAKRDWTQDTALIELLRARLEGVGPVTETELAGLFQCSLTLLQTALLRQLSGFDTKPTMAKPSAGLLRRDTFKSLLDGFYQCLEVARRRLA
jgi:hypothetical protein